MSKAEDITYSRIPADALERWAVTRACVQGDQAMRAAKLLPFLNKFDQSAENIDRNAGYVDRAVYYNATGRTLDGLIGTAFKNDPAVTLPPKLAYLRTDCDGAKNSIYQQSQAVVSNLLQAGRHGLFVDLLSDGRPAIKSYAAENIINWRYEAERLMLVVLFETVEEPQAEGYGIDAVSQWRELYLDDQGRYACRLWRMDKDGRPQVHPVADQDGQLVEELVIRTQTKTSIDFIPFRFVGARNNDAAIDDVPLYALARLNVAHYRNSADYEDSVFFVGQAQPVVSGLTEEWRDHMESQTKAYIGSRAPFLLPVGASFSFAQPGPNTLVKEAMDQKEMQMVALGARLLDQTAKAVTATQNTNDKEVSTSVLSMCAANTNEAYQTGIGWCALLTGNPISEEEAQAAFKIDQEYSRTVIDSQAITAMVAAWQTRVIALPDLRAYLRAEGIIATERTNEDIDADLEAQGPALGSIGDDPEVV